MEKSRVPASSLGKMVELLKNAAQYFTDITSPLPRRMLRLHLGDKSVSDGFF